MKRIWCVCALLALFLLLAGCRVRVLEDTGKADIVLREETTVPTEPPTEPETEPPTVPPSEETMEPTEPSEVTEAAQESAPAAQIDHAAFEGTASSNPPAPAETDPPREALTVTYDCNGGDSGSVTTTVYPGEPYGAQPEAYRRGWSFDGWWTQPEGGQHILPDTIVSVQEDHVLFAHWVPGDNFTVYFDGNGGRVKSRELSLQLCEGDAYGALPTPIREGYDFLGWWTLPDGGEQITEQTLFPGNGDQTLYAHWEYDPVAFWSFTLQNRTQQIYLCQQTNIYYEGPQEHETLSYCGLISDTGSFNIAAYLDGNEATDDWVLAKNPAVIIKCVYSMDEAETARAAVSARFGGKPVFIVTPDALGDGVYGLYARLHLAKALYGDWYYDVDLSVAAAELGLAYLPIS